MTKNEQMELIDVHGKDVKPIVAAARRYRSLMAARKAALEKEVEQKQKVLAMVKAANLKPLDGGVIKFNYDGVTISVTPRDELIQVKEESEE